MNFFTSFGVSSIFSEISWFFRYFDLKGHDDELQGH